MTKLDDVREQARKFEQSLPEDQRKHLGQFFTGVRLGKILAHLALDESTRTVLDPLAGHGDLLDAIWEAAIELGIPLARLDAIEVDKQTADMCQVRLDHMREGQIGPDYVVVNGNAFEPRTIQRLPLKAYDLVITNPPYVRYQTRRSLGPDGDNTRKNLLRTLSCCLPSSDRTGIWKRLVEAYSGLADLSIPAWFLSGALVKPGGHLAMVVPATWRSRDYADVVRYLLIRCFEVKAIVEDEQPGWFIDAQVRTNLVVAQRLEEYPIDFATRFRKNHSTAPWLTIAPEAASPKSLVGTAFDCKTPEGAFASWSKLKKRQSKTGIAAGYFHFQKEWANIQHQSRLKAWFRALEGEDRRNNERCLEAYDLREAIPHPLQSIMPDGPQPIELQDLDKFGIKIGQGLRTGCNGFFYVEERDINTDGSVLVETSSLFGKRPLSLPTSTLKPVVRNQSDVNRLECNQTILGRVLDLREWVLPEDIHISGNESLNVRLFSKEFKVMPDQLAAHVRVAARTRKNGKSGGPLIPELSAVRTNIRTSEGGHQKPRYWYMLPDFAVRHRPAAFVPRINGGIPWVEANADNPFLVDANFATFWSPSSSWSRFAIKSLLNSSWSRAYMEAIGTPMGGGALKLEATHLRQILLPRLSVASKAKLHDLGKSLFRDDQEKLREIDRIVLGPFISTNISDRIVKEFADSLRHVANQLSSIRQRRT